MKKIFSVIAAIIIFTAANVLAAGYVGNINSKIFHYDDCKWVGKMQFENKTIFSSRDEAIQQGYRPCKKCNP